MMLAFSMVHTMTPVVAVRAAVECAPPKNSLTSLPMAGSTLLLGSDANGRGACQGE